MKAGERGWGGGQPQVLSDYNYRKDRNGLVPCQEMDKDTDSSANLSIGSIVAAGDFFFD